MTEGLIHTCSCWVGYLGQVTWIGYLGWSGTSKEPDIDVRSKPPLGTNQAPLRCNTAGLGPFGCSASGSRVPTTSGTLRLMCTISIEASLGQERGNLRQSELQKYS